MKINIFDFDGTIAETNLLKTEAFSYISKPFGEDVNKWFVEYHRANGGVTRQVKIKELCHKFNDLDLYDSLMEQYASFLKENWFTSPLLKGFRIFIESSDTVNIILSGGSKVEIEDYLEHHKLSQYFEAVYGNPISKYDNLETIKDKYLNGEVTVDFYGDSRLDFELSESIGANFIFQKQCTEWDEWHLSEGGFYTVIDGF